MAMSNGLSSSYRCVWGGEGGGVEGGEKGGKGRRRRGGVGILVYMYNKQDITHPNISCHGLLNQMLKSSLDRLINTSIQCMKSLDSLNLFTVSRREGEEGGM